VQKQGVLKKALNWAPVPKKNALPKVPVAFIETMDCLPVSELPEGKDWSYELKLDGYRLEVVRSGGATTLYSRRQNILNKKFDYIAAALDGLPEGTVLDGELVAIGHGVASSIKLGQERSSCGSHPRKQIPFGPTA
jgi:ATP-dependent DNA ligase